MGAISPGRWHVWQFCWRMGRTALLKVTAAEVCCAVVRRERPVTPMPTSKPARAARLKTMSLRPRFGLYTVRARARLSKLERGLHTRALAPPGQRGGCASKEKVAKLPLMAQTRWLLKIDGNSSN